MATWEARYLGETFNRPLTGVGVAHAIVDWEFRDNDSSESITFHHGGPGGLPARGLLRRTAGPVLMECSGPGHGAVRCR